MAILDIIIPTYRDEEGLRKTLSSIDKSFVPNIINITVEDDCSGSAINYQNLQDDFPNVNFIYSLQNEGPAMARQHGINSTYSPYIMFIDSGDYVLSKFALLEVINAIQREEGIVLFTWPWLREKDDGTVQLQSVSNALLHGKVFSRKFIENYNISFSNIEPYANEDIAFTRLYRMIINALKINDENLKLEKTYQLPIYMYTYNPNSLVHKNNEAFSYLNQVRGFTRNMLYSMNLYNKTNLNKDVAIEDFSFCLGRTYYDFLQIFFEHQEYAQDNWDYIREFYVTVYKCYGNEVLEGVSDHFTLWIPLIKKIKNLPKTYKINPKKFFNEIMDNELIPSYYFDI